MNAHESHYLYSRFLADCEALKTARMRFLREAQSFADRPSPLGLPAFRVVQDQLVGSFEAVFETESLLLTELASRGIDGPLFCGHLGVATEGEIGRRTPWSFVSEGPRLAASQVSYAVSPGDFLRIESPADQTVLFEGIVAQHADGNLALGDVPFDRWSVWFSSGHPAQYVPLRRELRAVP